MNIVLIYSCFFSPLFLAIPCTNADSPLMLANENPVCLNCRKIDKRPIPSAPIKRANIFVDKMPNNIVPMEAKPVLIKALIMLSTFYLTPTIYLSHLFLFKCFH